MTDTRFGTIEQAITDIAAGKLVIVADDDDRENEGDLICAAEFVTPEMINFMIKRAGGLICLALTGERADYLDLPQMSDFNTEEQRTAFTVSIDAAPKYGVTTGISAQDRAKTIQVAVASDAVRSDLRRPGHVFPLRGSRWVESYNVSDTLKRGSISRGWRGHPPPRSCAKSSMRMAPLHAVRSSRPLPCNTS